MKSAAILLTCLLAASATLGDAKAAPSASGPVQAAQPMRPTEADRKILAGRLLLKWGGYVEKVEGRDRKQWSAALWPSLATADLDNLGKASRAVTYEGMRNALLGQRPYDDQVIDRTARASAKAGGPVTKALGSLAEDLVFTPITPCRIVDTRNIGGRITSGDTRALDASSPGGSFSLQGGDAGDCGIPANPAALALSVTGLGNTSTGYLRVFPFDGTSAQGSPVPLNAINTTATNDIIVPVSQGALQELKVFSTATTHYAAFVTGYFMAPRTTALECIDVSTSGATVGPGGVTSFITSRCPAGYDITGGGCTSNTFSGRVVSTRTFPEGHFCAYQNDGASSLTATAHARCCRVPGR